MVGPRDGGHGGWDPYGNNRGALYVVTSGLRSRSGPSLDCLSSRLSWVIKIRSGLAPLDATPELIKACINGNILRPKAWISTGSSDKKSPGNFLPVCSPRHRAYELADQQRMLPEHRQQWMGDRSGRGRQLRMHIVAVTQVGIRLS